MKSLIIYSSRSGNTGKLARAVYSSFPGEKEIVSISDLAGQDANCDLIVLGFPVMAGRVEPRAKKYLSAFNCKARLFLFITHGSLKESELVAKVLAQALELLGKVDLVGTFTCQGEVDPKVIDKLKRGSKPPAWLDEAAHAKGHPGDKDIAELTDRLKKIVAL
ncbi:MAG: flavodoxin family protein [Desulfobacterales bacterium]|nr:MAG: flavodoxin family protein [Desulfobacterales bacterium]